MRIAAVYFFLHTADGAVVFTLTRAFLLQHTEEDKISLLSLILAILYLSAWLLPRAAVAAALLKKVKIL